MQMKTNGMRIAWMMVVAMLIVGLTGCDAGYVPLLKCYTFPSEEERERTLYKNLVQVGMDVKEIIKDVVNRRRQNDSLTN